MEVTFKTMPFTNMKNGTLFLSLKTLPFTNVKNGRDPLSYLTCGRVKREYPFISVCMSNITNAKRESPKASISINFFILEKRIERSNEINRKKI